LESISAMKILLLLCLCLLVNGLQAQNNKIIPQPDQQTVEKGQFNLSGVTPLITRDLSFNSAAEYLQAELLKTVGITLARKEELNGAAIVFTRDNSLGPEAYKLQITEIAVIISAGTDAGAFYGVISLLQLIRQATVQNQSLVLPALTLADAPRYGWRGILLDESRHFFGKTAVKKMLDWMAFYKFNRFHWHLTDEPGWRLEIRKFPRLALVGGVGSYSNSQDMTKFYTQEDIKEIIYYAQKRHITIIPEIDMPGHASAANRAYPEFSGGGSQGYPDFTFHPGKDETYSFLTRILKETDVLFPSQMIHLGGDEVHFGNEKWKTDPSVRRLMKRHNLLDLPAVENYFIRRMADSLFSINNKILLWDEAVDSQLPIDKTIIFWWRHDQPNQLKKAMEKGFPTVLTPRIPFYLDFMQDSTQQVGRKWGSAFSPIESIYSFSVKSLPVSTVQESLILGIQGALWTENISTESRLEYMLFPRIAALSETAWTQEKSKNLSDFMNRMKSHLRLYKQEGVYYYNPFDPKRTPEPLDRFELK